MQSLRKRTFSCPDQHEQQDWKWNYEPAPQCNTCGQPTVEGAVVFGRAPGVHGDDIPGGMDVPNAICHPDGTPRRFYTKSAIRKAANEAGWTISGETPKPHLTRRSHVGE